MAFICKPIVRQVIPCDDILADERWPNKPVLVGPISLIHWTGEDNGPMTLPKLCVFLVLTDGRGAGHIRLSCVKEDTSEVVFTSPWPLSFAGANPTDLLGVNLRLNDCRFPEAGVYSICFLADGEVMATSTVHVR